jgi:glycosyltransferase involved in cell wall biosynthesis
LLYIGRLERMKGVHTLVGAMRDVPAAVTLDIVGSGEPDYTAELQAMVSAGDLGTRVRLRGPVPRTQIPLLLRSCDALVFPSEWEEPFARSVLEAMAAGLPVIGTTTGGTGELLIDGVTGLTYAAGNAQDLAVQIRRLADDPQLRRQLAATGCETVHRFYTIGRMVDELEAELIALAQEPVLTSC